MLEPLTENSTECTVRTCLRIICMCTFTAFIPDAQAVAVCVCLSPLSKKLCSDHTTGKLFRHRHHHHHHHHHEI